MTRIARPKALWTRSPNASRSRIACTVPLATSTATAASATVEKRLTDPASTGVRSSGSSTRVAEGRASSSSATPPTHTAMASTCRKLAGTSTQDGSSVAAWPASAGVRHRKPSRATSAAAAARETRGARTASRTPTTTQASSLRPQTVPKRVWRTSSTTSGSRALHSNVPPAIAPWNTSPRADMAVPSAAATSSRSRVRRAKASRARVKSVPAPPAAASAGLHTASDEHDGARRERERQVRQRAHDPEADLRHDPRSARVDQLIQALGRRAAAADREDEAAHDRMRVGGDHPVGRGVGAVSQAVAQAHRDRIPAPVGVFGAPAIDPVAATVVYPHGAERGLHGLAEAEHHASRGMLQLRAARRRGGLQHGMRLGDRRAREQERHREGGERHGNVVASPGLPHRAGRTGATAAAPDDQDQNESRERPRRRGRCRRPAGNPPPCSPTQISRPWIVAGRLPTVSGTFQSKILVRRPSSFTWGGSVCAIQWMRWSCQA